MGVRIVSSCCIRGGTVRSGTARGVEVRQHPVGDFARRRLVVGDVGDHQRARLRRAAGFAPVWSRRALVPSVPFVNLR